MKSKDKRDVTVRAEDNKSKMTKGSRKVGVIKGEDDKESERGGSGIRCSVVDTCGNGQMEQKK